MQRYGNTTRRLIGRFAARIDNAMALRLRPRRASRWFVALAAFVGVWPIGAAATPTIWFAADDPVARAAKGRPPNDYMSLFTSSDAWAANVGVIEVSMQFVHKGQDADLLSVIHFVSAHHIRLAMAGLMLVSEGTCGIKVEGYAGPRSIETVAQRILRLGGQLSYIAMDEPLFYGSVYDGPRSCQTPIQTVAAAVATRIQHATALFPDLQVGDVEPIGSPPRFDWPEKLTMWFEAYRAAVGRPLAFFHADVSWMHDNWQNELRFAANLSRRSGSRFGIVYNGNPTDPDGVTWANNALSRARNIERDLGVVPDDAVIQSWMPFPDEMLPPSTPGTLTSVLSGYTTIHR